MFIANVNHEAHIDSEQPFPKRVWEAPLCLVRISIALLLLTQALSCNLIAIS